MDTFRLGEPILHEKLGIVGVVTDEKVFVKHVGNLLVRRVKVQVGEDLLEWMTENCKPFLGEQSPALANNMAVA